MGRYAGGGIKRKLSDIAIIDIKAIDQIKNAISILPGTEGASAYQVAVDNGYTGTESEWLLSLLGTKGADGTNGNDGHTPVKGIDYFDGAPGTPGSAGTNGYTPIKGVDYFDGVKGDKGDQGDPGSDANVILHESTYNHVNYNTAYSHSQVVHAPSAAQKNSDIIQSEIEAKLTGVISTHSHSGGADPFIAKLVLSADKPTGANVTPVTLGLSFNYEANSKYVIDIYAIVAPTAATTGFGFMIDVSSVVTYVATFVSHQLAITGTLSGAASIGDLAVTSSGVSSGMVSTASQFVYGGGLLVTGANTGTATFYFRSETTAVTTCKMGSVIRVMKI